MTVEIGIMLAVISGAIGIASFFGGKLAAEKNSGKAEGKILTDIEYLKKGSDEIRHLLREEQKGHRDEMQKLRDDFGESIRRLHERIDKLEKA